MEEVEGDITRRKSGVILHQVNCYGVMGSGVALAIRNAYPRVFEEYRTLCETTIRISSLLGSYQVVRVSPKLVVINIFGQVSYGGHQKHTDTTALEFAFKNISRNFKKIVEDQQDTSIHHPLIGCGTGGGDWDKIKPLIIKTLGDDTFLWRLSTTKPQTAFRKASES